ncbi:MAG: hypothetical protein WBE76_18125 [Terracidiphilus sp.]
MTEISVEKIRSDQQWVRYFSALCNHYSNLLAGTALDAQLIGEATRVVYLVDADVIRNVAEMTFQDHRLQSEALQFFQNPDIEFAIPLGAFQELALWIRSLVPGSLAWFEDQVSFKSMSRDELVRELGEAFELTFANSINESTASLKRLSSVVQSRGLIVERLAHIFERPAF